MAAVANFNSSLRSDSKMTGGSSCKNDCSGQGVCNHEL